MLFYHGEMFEAPDTNPLGLLFLLVFGEVLVLVWVWVLVLVLVLVWVLVLVLVSLLWAKRKTPPLPPVAQKVKKFQDPSFLSSFHSPPSFPFPSCPCFRSTISTSKILHNQGFFKELNHIRIH